jgi:hypothetical protein
MRSKLFSVLPIFSLLFAALTAQGQESVSMKIDVVAWGDSIGGLSFKSGKKKGTITAQAFTYSESVSYSGPKILEIHQSGSGKVAVDKGPGTAEDKDHESIPLPLEEPKGGKAAPQTPLGKELARRREEEPTLVALVPLPSNTRRATVLLAPIGDGTYQAYVIDDDPSKLPLGKLRVHNLAPMAIGLKFSGGQKKALKTRDSFLVNAKNGQTIYQLSYMKGDKWKVQENNIMAVRPNEQTQFIVLRSRNQYFLSSDGASGGFLQTVTLRRRPNAAPTP